MQQNFNAYILAGGKSSRMGTDKGLLSIGDTTFVQKIASTLQNCIQNPVYVVGNPTLYEPLGLNIIPDIYPDLGPVGGIFTALEHSDTSKNIILSVDIPLITQDIIYWILKHSNPNYDINICEINNRINPLIGIYDKKCKDVFRQNLLAKNLKLLQVLEQNNFCVLQLPQEMEYFAQNINYLEDYLKIKDFS